MAQTTTLQDLIDRGRRRFDEGNSGYIDSTTGWPELINEGLAALHNGLVSADPSFVQSTVQFAIVKGTKTYDLPDDFLYDIAVFMVDSNQAYIPLPRFMTKEYRGGSAVLPPTYWVPPMRYDIRQTKFWLDPMPSANATVEMWYTPHYRALVNTTDVLPSWLPPGWEEFIVNYAVVSARFKEQSASSEDMNVLLKRMQDRIEKEAMSRDLFQAKRVVDAEARREWYYGWPY